MAFEKIVPAWHAQGTEPPDGLKESGFEGGYKPAADIFNWFWHGVSEALLELQNEAAVGKQTLAVGTDLDTVTVSGFYRLTSGHAHAPNGSDYGQLLVMHGGGDTITQIAASYIYGTLWTRSGNLTDVAGTGSWLDWKRLSTTDDAPAQLVYSRYSLDTTSGGTELDDLLETIIADMDKSSVRVVAIHDTQGYSALGGGTSFITIHAYSASNVVLSAYKYNGAAFRTRVKASGAWSDWSAVYSTANKPTPADIGAAASSHNHSASEITSGTLPVTRGGTGKTVNPNMLVNLGSTSAASVFAASPRPGVTGTLPVARGGTGQTSVDSTPTSGSSKMVTSGGVYTALADKAASSHDQAASTITAGTFASTATKMPAGTDYTTARIRNAVFTTTDPGAGTSSDYVNGTLVFVYE